MIRVQRIYPVLSDEYKYGLDMGHRDLKSDSSAVYGIYVDDELKKWGASRHVKGRMNDYRAHNYGNDMFVREQIIEALKMGQSVYIEVYIFPDPKVKVEQLEIHGNMHDVAYIDGDSTSLERSLRSISISEGFDEPWEKQPRGDVRHRNKRK